jgi:hypothetical protein
MSSNKYQLKAIKVGVILPSRGLMFSKTADELLQNLKDIPHIIYFAHGLPIPDCFEEPTNRALDNPTVSHLWYVEDDMILKPNTLSRLLDIDKAVVMCDYPTTKEGHGAMFFVKKEPVFGGTGCMLVKREVFDELAKPYFRTDICWNIRKMEDCIKIVGIPRGKSKEGYGLHDVNFGISLRRMFMPIPIHDTGFKLGQRKLISLGKAGSNNGAHLIEEWTKLKKNSLYHIIKKWPTMPGANKHTISSVIIDGKELMIGRNHGNKLIRMGLAEKPPKKYLIIDDSEVI